MEHDLCRLDRARRLELVCAGHVERELHRRREADGDRPHRSEELMDHGGCPGEPTGVPDRRRARVARNRGGGRRWRRRHRRARHGRRRVVRWCRRRPVRRRAANRRRANAGDTGAGAAGARWNVVVPRWRTAGRRRRRDGRGRSSRDSQDRGTPTCDDHHGERGEHDGKRGEAAGRRASRHHAPEATTMQRTPWRPRPAVAAVRRS